MPILHSGERLPHIAESAFIADDATVIGSYVAKVWSTSRASLGRPSAGAHL